MSGGLYIGGDTSGSVLLYPTPVAGATTITIAAQSGTLNVAGPLIVVKLSTGQSMSAGTQVVIAFDTKVYDTNTCFNTSNYRFTPNVAGYYQVNLLTYISGGAGANETQLAIQKNGSDLYYVADIVPTNAWALSGSGIVYCNGTTDYVTGAFYCAAAKTINASQTYMSASLIRTA